MILLMLINTLLLVVVYHILSILFFNNDVSRQCLQQHNRGKPCISLNTTAIIAIILNS